jgi:hypothetical protein
MRDGMQSSPDPEGHTWIRRALALNRHVYRLFSTRWFWLIVGLFVGGVGLAA